METLFIYIAKSSGLIGLFFFSYYFLLRKETFFTNNRWFLLGGLFTSVSLPFLVYTQIVWIDPTPIQNLSFQPSFILPIIEKESFEINWNYIIFAIYSIGFLVFLIKFTIDFYSLKTILKGKKIQQQADFKFIDTNQNIAPFSYFNYIVYNSSLYNATELENIIEHEKVHSEQNHTVDVLISRLFCMLFWFNPIIWLYKKAIIQNLEFIADSEASKKISDKKTYQYTLLKITTHENCIAITNHFYQSLIKKRIIMLNKNQSKKQNYWKYTIVFPALIAFVLLFQVKVVAQEKIKDQETKTNLESVDLTKIKEDLNTLPEGKEIYINGEKSTQKELDKLSPDEIESIDVINKKTDNPSLLVTTKHLTKPIKITDKDIYIDGVKSTNAELDKLDKDSIDKMDVITSENRINITTKNQKPIIIIDGSRTVSNFKIEDIPTDQIESINVIKGKISEQKYGSDGKNGAIEIITKNAVYATNNKQNNIDKAMIIINGEKAGSEVKMTDINQNAIKKIDILKGKSAIDKYGKEGENGVVEITTNTPNIIITKVAIGHPITLTKEEEQNKGNEINGWTVSSAPAKYGIKQDVAIQNNIDYKKVIIIIDGEISNERKLNKLDPNKIASINVQKFTDASQKIKDEKVKQYGEKALNGIIEIQTKK